MARTSQATVFTARTDMFLQRSAERVHLRRSYFDLREYARAKTERIDLEKNRRLNAIFVHVPKCAGSSIERQIGIRLGHRTATYFLHADRKLFARAFTFALVRDPFDRLVSAFHYLKNHTKAPLDIAWADRHIAGFDSFQDFADELQNRSFREAVLSWIHFVPQWYYLCDRRGEMMVDCAGKLEEMDAVLARVNAATGLSLVNERTNRSTRGDVGGYYSAATARTVAEIYAEDFRIFGYDPRRLV